MSVTQPPKDTPFGLEPNIAAGLSYLFIPVVAIIMLVGGGTNRFVKWHASQAIGLAIFCVILWIAMVILGILFSMLHLGFLTIIFFFAWIAVAVFWFWGIIGAFMSKEVRLPLVGDLTSAIFKGVLA